MGEDPVPSQLIISDTVDEDNCWEPPSYGEVEMKVDNIPANFASYILLHLFCSLAGIFLKGSDWSSIIQGDNFNIIRVIIIILSKFKNHDLTVFDFYLRIIFPSFILP